MAQREVQSKADLAEDLIGIEPDLTVATVTAVVMQLSENGVISLDDLAQLARSRLESLVACAEADPPRVRG